MKNTKNRIILIITILLIISLIFIYIITAPIKITPQPAEINIPNEITVMTEDTFQLEPEVKSDIDLGLVDMPEVKDVFGLKVKAKYKINDFIYSLTYSSSDETIAIVNEAGLICPVSTGETVITVSAGEIRKEINCIVKEYIKPDTMPEEIIILIDNTSPSVHELGEYQVLNTEFQMVDSDIATVDSNGFVTGIKKGISELKTTLSNGETATTEIKVLQPVYDIEVSDKSVNAGRTVKINAKLLPEGADYGTSLTYSSSDTSVATVNNNGVITGKKAGSATITVKSEYGVEKTLTVTVKKVVAPAPSQSSSSTSQSSGNTSSGGSSTTAPSQPQPAGPTTLSSSQISALVAAGNAALGDRYFAEANSYDASCNILTVNKTYDQVYAEMMYLISITYPYGRVFNIGDTIIVAN